jgi:hypothetical protein
MDNESGSWGSRSNEPPKLATVRRLHLDDGEGSSATATEEWYETERLTGQITSRARNASPTDRTAPSQNEAPVILDWRHIEATPPPTALQRLGQRLGRRNLRGSREFEPRRQNDDQPITPARRVQPATLAAATEEPPPAAREQAAAHEHDGAPPSGPRLSLREREDRPPEHPKRRFAPKARVRVHRERLDLRRGALVSAVLLSVGTAAVFGISSQMSSTAKPPQTRLTAVTSAPAADLNTAAKTVIGALAALNSQARRSQASHHAARPPQRAQYKTRVRAHAHAASTRLEATSTVSTPPAPPASSNSYSNSSSSPAYSQPVSSEPAQTPTSSAPQRQNNQPAFGANGALGPGTGSPGTQ